MTARRSSRDTSCLLSAMLLLASCASAPPLLPPQAPAQKGVFEPWAAELAAASDGRIEIQMFPAMQLGGKAPQLADQVKSGITDINGDGIVQLAEIALDGDMVVLATPEIAGLPYVVSGLIAAGGLAAAL